MADRYAIFNNGVFVSVALAESDFDPGPGRTKELFDPENPLHKRPTLPSTPRVPPKYVSKKDFLFSLFTATERGVLLRNFKIADTEANWPADTPNGTEVMFRTLVEAKENLDTVENVELASEDVTGFLMLCGYLGVFGDDANIQAKRIAAISTGVLPDGTYVEKQLV